jgi:MFS family permease
MGKREIGSASIVRGGNRRWVSGRRLRVLLSALGMCFMIMLDSNIVAVLLPSIARDLGAAFSDIEWMVSAYVLTFAALLMPSGALADRIGRRRIALVGLSVFTLSSLLCGLVPGALILNIARRARHRRGPAAERRAGDSGP